MISFKKASLTALISTSIAMGILSSPAHAISKKAKSDIQAATTFSAGAILGGIAGGPIGFILGAAGGAFLGDQAQKSVTTERVLEESQNEITYLNQTITIQKEEVAAMKNKLSQNLEFQIMFTTGNDQVAEHGAKQLQVLAQYLIENPHLNVKLDGHSDPRGTDRYNNTLSAERAISVAETLMNNGIDEDRIEVHAHGSDMSLSSTFNQDNYALDRRVNITIYSSDSDGEFAVAR